MDAVDHGTLREQQFTAAALSRRTQAPKASKALNQASDGTPLCIDCDIDITARRAIFPHTQRCIDCQQDEEKRRR